MKMKYVGDDLNGRRFYRDDEGNGFVEINGVLHSTTDEGEPIAPYQRFIDKRSIGKYKSVVGNREVTVFRAYDRETDRVVQFFETTCFITDEDFNEYWSEVR